MKDYEDLNALKEYHNGSYMRIVFSSYPRVRKEFEGRVMKITQGTYRTGIEYISTTPKEVVIKPVSEVHYPITTYTKKNMICMVTKKDLSTSMQLVLRFTKNHKHTSKSMLLWCNDEGVWEETTLNDLVAMNVMTEAMAHPTYDNSSDIFKVKVDNILAIGKGCGLDTI